MYVTLVLAFNWMFIDFYGLPKVLQKVHGNYNFDKLESVIPK